MAPRKRDAAAHDASDGGRPRGDQKKMQGRAHSTPRPRRASRRGRKRPKAPQRAQAIASRAGDDLIVEGFRFSDNQDRYQAEALKQKGSHPADGPNVFYKDATPKADHYIQFVVRLPSKLRKKGQPEPDWPLDVELGFAPTDTDPSYSRVADQGHLRRCESPRRDGDAKSLGRRGNHSLTCLGARRGAASRYRHASALTATPRRAPRGGVKIGRDAGGVVERPRVGAVLRYRIELGSYRQGDRRFCLRVSLMKRDDVGEAGPA